MKLNNIFSSQILKNVSWNLVGSVVYPLLVFASTPILINKLGVDLFGIWILINTSLQLISAFNFGLGDINIKVISEYLASPDQNKVKEVIQTTFAYSLVVGSVLLLIGYIVIYIFQRYSLMDIPAEHVEIGYSSFKIACVLFLFKFFEVILLSIYQGFGLYNWSAKWLLLSRSLILIANVWMAIAGYSLQGLMVMAVIMQAFTLIAEVIHLKIYFPFVDWAPKFKTSYLDRYFNYGFWTWSQTLLAVASTQIDKFIIAIYSFENLAFYSIASMLAMQFHSIFVSISSWMLPMVSKKVALKESLDRFYNNTQVLLLGFAFTSLVFFLIVENAVLTWWLGEDISDSTSVYVRLFIYYNLMLVTSIIPYFFLNGSGRAQYNTVSEFVLKFGNFVGMVVFYFFMGELGLIIGLIVTTALLVPYKAYLVTKLTLNSEHSWKSFAPQIIALIFIIATETSIIPVKIIIMIVGASLFYGVLIKKYHFTDMIKKPLKLNL